MSYSVQVPWNYTREREQMIIQAEVLKNVLRNICKQHRFFQQHWLQQRPIEYNEIRQLVRDMVDIQLFMTNRKEQITTALHCLVIWLNYEQYNHEDYVQIMQIGPAILTQLESKMGNRYFHDIRVYRCKQLLKINDRSDNKISVRCYLLDSRACKLDYDFNMHSMTTTNEDYNFPQSKAGKNQQHSTNNILSK